MDRNPVRPFSLQRLRPSPPARVAWIEIYLCIGNRWSCLWSPPARVAWIEIYRRRTLKHRPCVATREGGVDRNYRPVYCHFCFVVATREGGVDRNNSRQMVEGQTPTSPPARVAWIEIGILQQIGGVSPVATREGGVDRNILLALALSPYLSVATREGGVDRNSTCWRIASKHCASPPARVAWIEITTART